MTFDPADYPDPDFHVTDGSPCPCHPIHLCAICSVRWPCIHGNDRPEVVVHNERVPQPETVQ